MSKYQDGDYIFLIWDNCEADYEVIKGHVTQEQAQTIINAEIIKGYPIKNIEHKYALWGFTDEHARADGYDRALYIHNDSGRGRFKITVCYPLDTIQEVQG